MHNDKDQLFENNDIQAVVSRYRDMLQKKTMYFFDVHEFESIIDFYTNEYNFNKASEVINFAIQQHPSSTVIKLKKAQLLIDNGRIEKGLALISEIEMIENFNYEVYILKGNAYALNGEINKALKHYNHALTLVFEDKEEVMYNISITLQNLGYFNEACSYLDTILSMQENNCNYLFDYAYCLEQLQVYDKCIETYQKYLDLEPYSEHVWHNLGMVYAKIKNYEKAIEAYEFALAINENYPTAHFNLANAHANIENYEKAILEYNEFNRYETGNVYSYLYLGECYEKIGNYDKATVSYNTVIEIDGKFSDGWYSKGNLFRQQNQFSNALDCFEKAVDLNKENVDYLFCLAETEKYIKKYDSAKVHFNKLLNIDNTDDETWILYSEIFFEEGDIHMAAQTLIDALAIIPKSAEIIFRLSGYFYALNSKKEFRDFFELGLKINFEEHKSFFNFFPSLRNARFIKRMLRKYKA